MNGSRFFAGERPFAVGMLRLLARAGLTVPQAVSQAIPRFPELGVGWLTGVARAEKERAITHRIIFNADWRQDFDWSRTLATGRQPTNVSVSMSIPVTDPSTGLRKMYHQVVVVPVTERLGDVFREVIRKMREDAALKGYRAVTLPTRIDRALEQTRIDFIDPL